MKLIAKTKTILLSVLIGLFLSFSFYTLFHKDKKTVNFQQGYEKNLKNLTPKNFTSYQKPCAFENLPKRKKIIVFWSSWCTHCQAQWLLLHDIKQAENILLVGINTEDQFQDAQKFIAKKGNPFHYNFVDKNAILLYKSGFIALPAFLILDQNNKIQYRHNGALTFKIFETKIKPILKDHEPITKKQAI